MRKEIRRVDPEPEAGNPPEPYRKCDGVNIICPTLLNRLQDGYAKGLNVLTMFNFSNGKEGPPLLAYKTSSRDRGVILNFCPFCGEELNKKYIERDESTK